ncbi:hypothetical protein BO70DRAFT_171494 [Aspergillus heteromorphus CBS 117.55]|uniref:Uncharacterized protein n=1 Tax=Aspergillus heteromorphus CBS 117.55 TaxID=1448321 RepID=A0A317V0F9_9EURO|nr:uncharacterized protein BO70DRAFT_171494 [Aspergillus heteromorphus CBS 117.55]PWY66861.1 hypothetical protein BO70DRAFT_171494 [Aspergillus heteromorphus CBS 117.55]
MCSCGFGPNGRLRITTNSKTIILPAAPIEYFSRVPPWTDITFLITISLPVLVFLQITVKTTRAGFEADLCNLPPFVGPLTLDTRLDTLSSLSAPEKIGKNAHQKNLRNNSNLWRGNALMQWHQLPPARNL